MPKLIAQKGGGVAKNENLGPCTKLNQKCMVKSSGWPHQNVSIYLILFFSIFYKIHQNVIKFFIIFQIEHFFFQFILWRERTVYLPFDSFWSISSSFSKRFLDHISQLSLFNRFQKRRRLSIRLNFFVFMFHDFFANYEPILMTFLHWVQHSFRLVPCKFHWYWTFFVMYVQA